jgi:benzoyl-CoA 2,3-dioxygenase component A
MDQSDLAVIKQHLIDPEICIRCNTCEATCPVGAITHDSATTWSTPSSATCAWTASRRAPPAASTTGARCRACAPTAVQDQLGWDSLPAELSADELAGRRW